MPSEKSPLKPHFADTEAYERRIRKFVPYYEDMLDSVLGCLKEADRFEIILELGCGSGNLSQKLLEKSHGCRLVAIDCVREMVEACRERFRLYAERFEVICADMLEFKRFKSFDHVLSNLALHYPETDKKKISVLKNVFYSLKPGGIFSFSVMLTSENPETTRKIWRIWEQDVFRHGVTQKELEEWYRTCHGSDYPVSPNLWLEWLDEVGFEQGELIWCETIFGILRAVKPG